MDASVRGGDFRWPPPGTSRGHHRGPHLATTGDFFMAMDRQQGGLARSAELAFTNPEAMPDEVATRAVVSVRASASTEERFVAEILYQRSRASSRLSEDELLELLAAAVDRAAGYNGASLTEAYVTGLESSG